MRARRRTAALRMRDDGCVTEVKKRNGLSLTQIRAGEATENYFGPEGAGVVGAGFASRRMKSFSPGAA
jgi:hypothetical protein